MSLATDPVRSGHASAAAAGPAAPATLVLDTFADTRRRGRVIGTSAAGGPPQRRLGADAEGVLAIDHHALRIQPLTIPGWGRAGISYGPVRREPGVALSVFLVNGHNLSRTYELKSFPAQVWRWMDGAKCTPVWKQLLAWTLHHRPRESIVRKLRQWWRHRKGGPGGGGEGGPNELWENLAVGFFGSPAPVRPLSAGNGMLVRAAADLDNGELCTGVAGETLPVFRSFQNVQVHYIVVLRERGASYYVAGPDFEGLASRGLGAHPLMRPVGIDPFDATEDLYPGVHQAVLGEIGFGIDSRVYGVKVERLPEAASWCTTAHAADRLTGDGPLSYAERGGEWAAAGVLRTADGAAGDGVAMLAPDEPSGLVHALLHRDGAAGEAALIVQVDPRRRLYFVLGEAGARLELRTGDDAPGEVVARSEGPVLPEGTSGPISVQVLDDGTYVGASVNGRCVATARVDDRGGSGTGGVGGVGLALSPGWRARDFEAHPRAVPIPAPLILGQPWAPVGSRVVVRDTFAGPAGPLEGRRTEVGDRTWARVFGPGQFELTGDGAARVAADPKRPCPGRTIYAVDWSDPDFADLRVQLTPPGTQRGQKHRCRAGFCFWQDPGTYILINIWLDDMMKTSSISSFFVVRGFEDIFEAVWTCLGEHRVHWGCPVDLRMVCDGERYHVAVNGEPVLYRALSDVYPTWDRMRITKVGLAATWEWGTDTGSIFRDFTARSR